MHGGWLGGAVALLGMVAVQSTAQVVAVAKPSSDAANPECPHTWGAPRALLPIPIAERERRAYGDPAIPMGTDDGDLPAYEFAVPRGRTNVPEFHDCQRLIEPTANGKRFGTLAAVFASDSLESYFKKGDPAGLLRVVALVYLPQGGSYAHLGLTSRFGCLVLRRDEANARAWMVPADRDTECATAPARIASGTPLYARVMDSDGVPPPVARWLWSSAARRHEIGVRCGGFWCQIGSTKPGRAAILPWAGAPVTGTTAYGNVGAYDEQELAEFSGATLRPGGNIGIVRPLADLAAVALAAPASGQWLDVARIHMGVGSGSYTESMNFGAKSLGPTSWHSAVLSLCRQDDVPCTEQPGGASIDVTACSPVTATGAERWVARVTRRVETGPPVSKYFCVLYRPHKGMAMTIPPVVRWRWRANDETIWVACPDGCCEVNANGFT